MTKINRIKKPADTVYFADNEYGSWRPIITDLGIINVNSDELNDVWQPEHLPYAPDGRVIILNAGWRWRGMGTVPTCFTSTGHAAWKKARLIIVNDWREDKN